MIKIIILLVLFSSFYFTQSVGAATYSASIKCSRGSGNTEYFSAKNDSDAMNEARRLLSNNSAYAGKACQLIKLEREGEMRSEFQNTKSYLYEVSIKCPRGSGNTEYFRAKSDLDADNEVRRLLNNNSSYAGKGCQAVRMERR